jgi:hypothetical protein
MLKNIFKNFVKSTLVVFLALILSNFLPAFIQSQQAEDLNHSQQIFDSQISLIPTTYAETTGTAGSGGVLSAEAKEIFDLLGKGNVAAALKKAKEKIEEVIPYTKFLETISYPIFIVIGALLDNQIFSSPVMRDVLGNVWSQVRDLCYYILAIYLAFVVIYNVFAASSDSQYSLKKSFQEVIVAFMLINLSWYGAIFVLDVSNVAINITYSWATQYENSNPNLDLSKTVTDICDTSQLKTQPLCTDQTYNKSFKEFLGNLDQRSLPLTIAVRFGKATDLEKIGKSVTTAKNDAFALVAIYFVKVFIFIVQFFSYLMLAYYLVIRIIYIWIYIALSPLIVLDKVLSGLSIDASEHFSKFFDYALIGPIKGGVGFTLSYMILDSISRTPSTYASQDVLNSVAVSIGSLDSFQSLLVYFASVAVIYEITLNMADSTAASGAFTWLRTKVQGTAKFVGSTASNTGLFLGRKNTNAKQFLNTLFPNANTLTSPSGGSGNSGNSGNPRPINQGDDLPTIVRKLNQGASITIPKMADQLMTADGVRALISSSLTPNQVLQRVPSTKRAALKAIYNPRTGTKLELDDAFLSQKKHVGKVADQITP